MKTIQGPGLFLAQFIGVQAPFDSLDGLAGWAAGLGFKSLQIPTGQPQIFNLELAAHSQEYCDEALGCLARHGLAISELSTHLQGQLVAVHPASIWPSTVLPHRRCAANRRRGRRGRRSSC